MMHQFKKKGDYMNIDIGVKIHNRFDIEVKDISSGEIVQKAEAENIVLNGMYNILCQSKDGGRTHGISMFTKFGKGTGVPSVERTTLFSHLGAKGSSVVEYVGNDKNYASYCRRRATIPSNEYIGETITEVGIGNTNNNQILTHALLKDVEGNQISIGPKTDTQEITIYSTIFAEVILPDGVDLLLSNNNSLISTLTGYAIESELGSYGNAPYKLAMRLFEDKTPTNINNKYRTGQIIKKDSPFLNVSAVNKTVNTGRIRFDSSQGNGKIWSLSIEPDSESSYSSFLRVLFPNSWWSGYQFLGKNIGFGDGVKTKFILPWSDTNTTKEHKIYLDGVLKTKDVDYTLANSESETSITFTAPPINNAVVTGDWWVDYIPKDSNHVLDITITITYGEGA